MVPEHARPPLAPLAAPRPMHLLLGLIQGPPLPLGAWRGGGWARLREAVWEAVNLPDKSHSGGKWDPCRHAVTRTAPPGLAAN